VRRAEPLFRGAVVGGVAGRDGGGDAFGFQRSPLSRCRLDRISTALDLGHLDS
jgi:hypothetical protein